MMGEMQQRGRHSELELGVCRCSIGLTGLLCVTALAVLRPRPSLRLVRQLVVLRLMTCSLLTSSCHWVECWACRAGMV